MIDVVTVSSTNFGPASTNCCPMKIFKPSTLVSLGIAIAAALVTQPVQATAISTLVITENSSTSLTATLNGTTALSVTNNFADNWTIALTGIFGTGQFWFEPDAAGFVNLVSFNPTLPGQLTVRSDIGPRIHGGTSGRHGGHPSTS